MKYNQIISNLRISTLLSSKDIYSQMSISKSYFYENLKPALTSICFNKSELEELKSLCTELQEPLTEETINKLHKIRRNG